MIELAPNHKTGLPLPGPVMPAAGTLGWGDEYRGLVDYSALGALVTNPVSWRPRRATHEPRLGTRGEALLVHTGLPNPGLPGVLRRWREVWARLECPVIVHLIGTTAADVAEAGELLAQTPEVAGVELGLSDEVTLPQALAQLRAVRRAGGQPVLVRLPFGKVETLALPLAEAGADALTLTAPPRGVLVAGSGRAGLVRGRLYSAALFPLLLHTLARWVPQLPVPVIAGGGIASAADARACLALGAMALQVDALLWREPALLDQMTVD